MKLKNLLIICMIFSFFMAAAFSPAVAQDFDAEVSMITDFNESVNLMPDTKNVDATPDDMDATLELWDGKAVVSAKSRNVHVEVSGYGRNIKSSDIVLEFYAEPAALLQLYSQIAPAGFRNASSSGCDFTLPTVYEEATKIKWIRVVVKDDDGGTPVYAWVKAVYGDAVNAAVFSPVDVTSWGDPMPIYIANSVNITLSSLAGERLYFWWKDGDGTIRAESTDLDVTTDIVVSPDSNWDPNFSIVYTNASYETFTEEDVTFDTSFTPYFDDDKDLNILTEYDASYDPGTGISEEAYFLYLPLCKDLDTTNDPAKAGTHKASVYYKGVNINIDATADGVFIGGNEYLSLKLRKSNLQAAEVTAGNTAADLPANWSTQNSKVVYSQVIDEPDDEPGANNIRYVAGPDDGVGPRLMGASIDSEDNTIVTLSFSEKLNASLINSEDIGSEIDIDSPAIGIDKAYIDPTDAAKIIVETVSAVEENKNVNFNFDIDATSDAVRDLKGNSAYRLPGTGVQTALERIVEKVEVTGVNIFSGPDVDGYFDGTTDVCIYFDKSMTGTDITIGKSSDDKHSYFVEVKPGLISDPNTGVKITNLNYKEDANGNYVMIELDGVIASTAEADLPRVKIIRDIKGGTPLAPLASVDRNVFLTPEDKVGPYLTSASFSLNPTHGDGSADLVEAEKATLTLNFSEEIDDEDLTSTSFSAVDAAWSVNVLKDAYVSGVPSSTVVLTLDDDADPYQVPFKPAGGTFYIKLVDLTDIEDAAGNDGAEDNQIKIQDTTPVWIESSIVQTYNSGQFLRITSKFGKQVKINKDVLDYKKNLIAIDDDPNMPYYKSGYNPIQFNNRITLTIDVSVDKATNWTPKVSFDLGATKKIEDYDGPSDNNLTSDFYVVADDGVKPRIKNATDSKIKAFETSTTGSSSSGDLRYIIDIPILFTEPLNPSNWANPTRANRFFVTTGDASLDYSIVTFVTSGQYACSGDRLTVRISAKKTIDEGKYGIKFGINPDYQVVDMNKNTLKTPTTPSKYGLSPSVPTGVWGVPDDVDGKISISPTYMKITGTVYDPNGVPFVGDGDDAVYAFSRDQLFVVGRDPSTDVVKWVSYEVNHSKCYGAGRVLDDGTYYMNVYGGSTGFANGEPIIIALHDEGTDDRICTTANLSNTEYSVAFQGGYVPVVKTQNLYLNEREEVKVRKGWNLISTSIGSSVYVDPVVSADTGLNLADFKNYIYGPDDALTGAGSLPSNVYTLSSATNRDSSALLFTISHPDLMNSIFAPYSTYGIADGLDDTLNNLPVFGPGLAFYVYLDENIADASGDGFESNWQIVLFGEKIPGPEYKVKVPNNQALVGHWGNVMYHTDSGQTLSTDLYNHADKYLPSTYVKDTDKTNLVYVNDIALGEGSNVASTLFAINVTDTADATLNVNSVSTFFNNSQVGPAVWWGTLDFIDYSDLSVVPPGCGAWIQIDGPSDVPYFVNYMSKP